ncbi:MAG: 4Fe-4S dicluster domain-containing protein [Spirochaetales bacterium]|nr:4Fe-4S dicluster domain-containing protein [Spirochaetales bacterium]
MNHQDLRAMEELCIQEHAPPCTSHCPVHVDVRGMIRKITENDTPGAFDLFRKAAVFPGIISRLCDRPCESFCNRKNLGGSLAINALERFCAEAVETAYPMKAAPRASKPLRDQRKTIAVIGGGLLGLTAALVLYEKGYQVTVFEAEEIIGGRLNRFPQDRLPPEVLRRDLSVFDTLPISIKTGIRIEPSQAGTKLAEGFEAVILAVPGAFHGNRFFETSEPGVFARDGGENTPWSPILDICRGKGLALSAERYIKRVSLTSSREFEGPYETQLYTNLQGKTSKERKDLFADPAEALAEAQRCFNCSCLECVRHCVYLEQFGSYPKRYVREISNNLAIVFGIKTAKPLVNSCSLCGLCAEVCPNSLDMSTVALHARREMVKKGSMPPAIHDFPVRDMLFSNQENCLLTRRQPGTEANSYVFFPGCRLSGLQKDHVLSSYGYLTSRLEGGVGLMLGCCGAPAKWSGREELFQETLKNFRSRWESLGCGTVITACSTCKAVLTEAFPEMETLPLWEFFLRHDLPPAPEGLPERCSILDPCTARYDETTRKAVRALLQARGIAVAELPHSGVLTQCCGYGGLVLYAKAEIAGKTVQRRLEESDNPYVAYCSMCREAFAGRGKPVWHLLDLVFGSPGEHSPKAKGPGISRQQDTRLLLKKELLETFWEEKMEERQDNETALYMDPAVTEALEKRLILLRDVREVIAAAEKTGQRLKNNKTNHLIAHLKPGIITYWVEYAPEGDGYRVYNAYSHRLEILEDR